MVTEKQVYFVQAGEDGPIKIGVAGNVAQRIKQLQTSSAATLILLGQRDGDESIEAELHLKFSHHRIRGEWFAPHAEVIAEAGVASPKMAEPARPAAAPPCLNLLQTMFVNALEADFGTDLKAQKIMAEAAGVSGALVASWLNGDADPTDEHIERLSGHSYHVQKYARNRIAIKRTASASDADDVLATFALFSHPAAFDVVLQDPDSEATQEYLRMVVRRFRDRPSMLFEGQYGEQFKAMAKNAAAYKEGAPR